MDIDRFNSIQHVSTPFIPGYTFFWSLYVKYPYSLIVKRIEMFQRKFYIKNLRKGSFFYTSFVFYINFAVNFKKCTLFRYFHFKIKKFEFRLNIRFTLFLHYTYFPANESSCQNWIFSRKAIRLSARL